MAQHLSLTIGAANINAEQMKKGFAMGRAAAGAREIPTAWELFFVRREAVSKRKLVIPGKLQALKSHSLPALRTHLRAIGMNLDPVVGVAGFAKSFAHEQEKETLGAANCNCSTAD